MLVIQHAVTDQRGPDHPFRIQRTAEAIQRSRREGIDQIAPGLGRQPVREFGLRRSTFRREIGWRVRYQVGCRGTPGNEMLMQQIRRVLLNELEPQVRDLNAVIEETR